MRLLKCLDIYLIPLKCTIKIISSLVLPSSDSVQKLGVKVKILGDLDLLPDKVRAAAIRVMEMTKNHDQYFLNICMPYTSMHEIHRAVDLYHSSSSSVTDDNNTNDNDADRPRFEDFLFTKESPEVDVLVRTSGESRLSDFLLWQVCLTV